MGRLIDVDQFLSDESEAYMAAQNQIADEKLIVLNELVHKKMQMLIADIPTVDAVPVVHGHWAWFEEICPSTTEHYEEIEDCGWKCSCCNRTLEEIVGGYWDDFYSVPKLNYCPNCGAKMDGERKEE